MTSDLIQQTLQLLDLAGVDEQRAEILTLTEGVPRILKSRKRASADAAAALEATREKVKGFQAHLKTLELELAAKEEAIHKANGNLLNANTNQEYTLMQSEIARKKEEKGQAEEEILKQFDVIQQGAQMIKDAEARVAEAAEEYRGFEERAQNELASHQGELDVLDAKRVNIRRAIKGDVLTIYDRAASAHGTGVCPVESDICQGCFSKLTPNDCSRLAAGRELVICRTCQRILYLPQALQASPH